MEALTPRDHELHQAVCNLILRVNNHFISSLRKTYIINCHSISRAVARHIPDLKVVSGLHISYKNISDGKCLMTKTIHSWLTTPDDAIIELYSPTLISIAPIIIPIKGEYAEANSGVYVASESVAGFMYKHVNTWRLRRDTAVLVQLLEEAKGFALATD